MARKKAVKIPSLKQAPLVPIDFRSALLRIFDNKHIAADNLVVGEAVSAFRESNYWLLFTESVEYVLRTILDGSNPDLKAANAEQQLGAQKGARLVLTTILGLERTAEIINNQIAQNLKREEENKEDADPEDNEPRKKTSNVGI